MTKRRVGQVTRGKTASNRLRQVDHYVTLTHAHVLREGSPLIVDLGYGAYPWTALEMWARWQTINGRIRLLGIEIDPARVAAALPYEQGEVIRFRLGGFNLGDLLGGEQARVIRAYNVLRQYEEQEVASALSLMARGLAIGGLLIEGTSTPTGRIVAFDLYRKLPTGDLAHQGLVFGTNFRERIEPVQFQAILPKRLIHHAYDPRPAAFFDAWRIALDRARGMGQTGERQRWIAGARGLGLRYPVDLRPRLVRRGYLTLFDPLT
ncbi:MAG: class I SAM-dependent methyltransferase [Anaerolineae bacterium]|jgi:hypothetical protein|nr:class I SAM-dependent methyltransferase [Anaerolineae bacterium]